MAAYSAPLDIALLAVLNEGAQPADALLAAQDAILSAIAQMRAIPTP
jgi:hypothetical protein